MGAFAQGWHRLHHTAIDEMADDAAHGGIASAEAFHPDQRPDLGPSPHGKVESEALNGGNQIAAPGPGAGPLRPPRQRFGLLAPAVQRGPRHAYGTGCGLGVKPVAGRACSNRANAPASMPAAWAPQACETRCDIPDKLLAVGQKPAWGSPWGLSFDNPSLGEPQFLFKSPLST